MKRPSFGFALVLIIALTAGCMNTQQPYTAATMSRSRAFALAVTVQGSLQPTPMQWSVIQAKFADEFAARGWVLVTDLALADYIVRVDFTPDPADPENTGNAVVVGVRDNPRKLLASMTTVAPVSRYPTSFGYTGTFQNALWSPSFSSLYSGWGDAYYEGYSYSSPTLNPVKPPVVVTQPPNQPYRHHHQPGEPGYCPPERDHKLPPVANLLPGDFATTPTTAASTTVASRDRSGTHSWSHNTSGSTSSRSDPNSSGSGRGFWGGDSMSSRVGNSSSSSDSSSSGSRSYSRSDSSSSGSRGDHTYSRGDWGSRGDSNSSRSDSSYSRSGSGSGSSYSRSDSSHSSSSGSSYSGSSSGSSHWSGSSSSGSSYSGSSSSSSGSSSPSSSSSSGSSSSGSTSTSSSTSTDPAR